MPRARTRSVSLRGPACAAFIEAQTGRLPETQEDASNRLSTFIHLSMHKGDLAAAAAILRSVERDGVMETAKRMTCNPSKTQQEQAAVK